MMRNPRAVLAIAALSIACIPANNAYSASDSALAKQRVENVRVLPLEGGINFRDLGGYRTTDSRTVKWQTVYRSGVMSNLTAADVKYLGKLGFQVVTDLRNTEARASAPALTKEWARDYVAWDYKPGLINELNKFTKSGNATVEGASEVMTYVYSQTAYQFKDIYAEIFDKLIHGETPLVFNCAAGKDRAGVMAALVLAALGVPRATVVADYAMSDDVVNYEAKVNDKLFYYAADNLHAKSEQAEGEVMVGPYIFRDELPPEVMRQMKASDPAYIEAVYAQLEKDHGSVVNFIQTELGVSDDELVILRDNLLE